MLGSLVWDEIHGRDPLAPPVQEWGGIAYGLAGMDAALREDWQLVPLIKVGRDLSREAAALLGTLRRLVPGGRCVVVPVPNNRVVLHYETSERRCERMAGGVPPWTWDELGPMVRDLDALYVNFISGFELSLGTAQALRRGFAGPIYADLHSLLLGMQGDGIRVPRPLPDATGWYGCFDLIQVNDAEMAWLSADPLSLAAELLDLGVSALLVTLGERGAVYVSGIGDSGIRDPGSGIRGIRSPIPDPGSPIPVPRTARIPAESPGEALDPTGCGDVFGATTFARLLAGDDIEPAVVAGVRAAGRNACFRGASGLAAHLRGELVAP